MNLNSLSEIRKNHHTYRQTERSPEKTANKTCIPSFPKLNSIEIKNPQQEHKLSQSKIYSCWTALKRESSEESMKLIAYHKLYVYVGLGLLR